MHENGNFVGLRGLQVRPGIDNFAALESYTSLDGVRIERSENGIFLMTVTYSDGFVKTVKVARR